MGSPVLPGRFMMASRRTLWTDYTSKKMHAANDIKSTQLIAAGVRARSIMGKMHLRLATMSTLGIRRITFLGGLGGS